MRCAKFGKAEGAICLRTITFMENSRDHRERFRQFSKASLDDFGFGPRFCAMNYHVSMFEMDMVWSHSTAATVLIVFG